MQTPNLDDNLKMDRSYRYSQVDHARNDNMENKLVNAFPHAILTDVKRSRRIQNKAYRTIQTAQMNHRTVGSSDCDKDIDELYHSDLLLSENNQTIDYVQTHKKLPIDNQEYLNFKDTQNQ